MKAVLIHGTDHEELVNIICFVQGSYKRPDSRGSGTQEEPIAVFYGKDGLVKHSYIYNTSDEPVFRVTEEMV